jgi:tRNA1Val (adenine37-N6)-methyltransferase
MPNNYFRFKQFIVFHDRCSMKVNTDGVLLGAWADVASAGRALDVGTGSGIIALMIAQRSQAWVDAVEIDQAAFLQAAENTDRSPWKDRIRIYHDSFQHFAPDSNTGYDHIVSNPPYFRHSLKPSDSLRSKARHDVSLTHEDLLKHVVQCLAPAGRLSVILPYLTHQYFTEIAHYQGLYPQRITRVRPKPGASFSRVLLTFGKTLVPAIERDELNICDGKNRYSAEYIKHTKDFYPGY